MQRLKQIFLYIRPLCLVIFLVACEEGAFAVVETKATLTLGIADAPIDEAKEVNITITKIEMFREGADWELYYEATDEDPAEAINLLDFSKGQAFKFATEELKFGDYEKIRLFLSDTEEDNSIILDNDTKYNLIISTDIQEDGIILASEFKIEKETAEELTLDFDVRKSIFLNDSNYSLQPVIKLIANDASGNIIFTESATEADETEMSKDDVYFLYSAGADVSAELTENSADSAKEQVAYEKSQSSAIAFVDGDTLKIIFPFMEYGSYDLYKLKDVGTDDEAIIASKQTGITLSNDDNGELIITD
jgi:hypothetical protein